MKEKPILIIGNTGKTGVRIQQRLEKLGYPTRGASRSSTPRFDWNEPATWQGVLSGVSRAYVSFHPDLAIPAAEKIIYGFVTAARDAGVEHLVLLSGRGEEGAIRAENVVKASGLSWNIVRASWFAQNFSEGFMLEGILNGELVLPECRVREPFIDVDDIADVAVAALTKTNLRNKLFEVTGPRSITFEECILAINAAVSSIDCRTIQYIPVPIEDYIDALKSQGFPEDFQWLVRELFTVVLDGRNTPVVNGVEEALGRPATDFNDYVKKALAAGAWAPQVQVSNA
jgi:Predicted nucleoside-diphosphate-sugar epimerases